MECKKWTTVYKVKKEKANDQINAITYMHQDSDWICTDFGHSIDSKNIDMFVMQPLQTHPYGEEFGEAPHGFEVLVINESQLEEYFEIVPGRNYLDEQRDIENKMYEKNKSNKEGD
ncbi:MAG: hypothetical protein K0R54_736 [Clostridiaceae bacterium]|nr:hypothetical protein [Clostridiaceae bacterium]